MLTLDGEIIFIKAMTMRLAVMKIIAQISIQCPTLMILAHEHSGTITDS